MACVLKYRGALDWCALGVIRLVLQSIIQSIFVYLM